MTLIPIWKGELKLPQQSAAPKKIGKNFVHRTLIQECIIQTELFKSYEEGYCEFRTKLPYPYNLIYLRLKRGKRRTKMEHPSLILIHELELEEISIETKFKWEYLPDIIIKERSVDEVVDSWDNKFQFRLIDEASERSGLRLPQLGAVHAIAAHFCIGKNFEPATIVLPTGTGKTETMLSALVYRKFSRVLVLVPTKVLRKQINSKFLTLGILPLIGVLPFNIERPHVLEIKNGLKSEEEAGEILKKSNIIIATPQILSKSDPDAINTLVDGTSDLMIDEAHHSPASTWDKIRTRFLNKRIIQFTATPFRNDEKEIGGKIIFNYKLGDAQKDGYYKSIRFHPIEDFREKVKSDREIALKAIGILKKDIEIDKNDHLLMVRTNENERASQLCKLYSQIAPEFAPVEVHSGMSAGENAESFHKLNARLSRIIVCVDMLGEGFDFPQLKIAAIHDYHKSLAITLQFIGRITRSTSGVGDAAVIMNIADPEVDAGLEKLYSANAEWDIIIRRLSEEKIERELKLQEIVEKLKQRGTLAEQISLRTLKPNFTAQIYRVNTNEWNPSVFDEPIPSNIKHYHSIATNPNLLIVLGVQENDVKWGRNQDINDIVHKLLIAYWNEEQSSLFVYCNDYDGLRVESIVKVIFDGQVELVSGSPIFNVLNNVEFPLAKNLGSSKTGVISFTQYFGPNVTDGLSEIEKKDSELSNIACLGYEEGEKVIWGAAKKRGKIWSMSGGTIDEWISWCDRIWLKVNSEVAEDNITKNFLRPIKLESYHPKAVISVQWGEKLQLKKFDQVQIILDNEEEPLLYTEIEILNIGEVGHPYLIRISTESKYAIYSLEINSHLDQGYRYELMEGHEVYIRSGKSSPQPFIDFMVKDPILLYYSDGSHSYNNYHIQPRIEPYNYDINNLEVWDWGKIPLNQESMGKEGNKETIQFKTFEHIYDEFDVIINDDGKGEAADLVCLKLIESNEIALSLVHCKNAVNNKPGADIRDLYTVCGQAQKSIKVKHRGISSLYNEIQKRELLWNAQGYTRFLKGSLKDFNSLKNRARVSKIKFNVTIVQPGISKNKISNDMLRILATTELFLKKTSDAELLVIVNK